MAQLGEPLSKDWVSQTLADLEELEINLELDSIKSMKKEKYKNLLKEAIHKKAFSDLKKKKGWENI